MRLPPHPHAQAAPLRTHWVLVHPPAGPALMSCCLQGLPGERGLRGEPGSVAVSWLGLLGLPGAASCPFPLPNSVPVLLGFL